MGFVSTYMVFNLVISIQCETSPYTYIPTVFSPSASFIHMIVFPLNESYFYPQVFTWWLLEPTSSKYLYRHSTHGIGHLNSPSGKLSYKESLGQRSTAVILLVRVGYKVEFDSDINCCTIKGGKHRKDLHQWIMSNHISKLNIIL